MAGRLHEGVAPSLILSLVSPSPLPPPLYLQVEVLLLAKLHHPNLIRLLGFCTEGNEALLVYDLCSNGSLEDRLLRGGGGGGEGRGWTGR